MQRPAEHLTSTADLDDLPQIENADAIRQPLHHSQVMGNEKKRQSSLAPKLGKEIDDLCLCRGVERRDRLISDNEVRPARQGASDSDSLLLAAGELVRESISHNCGKSDLRHEPLNLTGSSTLWHDVVHRQRLGQQRSHAHLRVQATGWVLKHHLKVAPLESQLFSSQAPQVDIAKANRAGRRPKNLQNTASKGCLAAPRFTYQAQRLTSHDLEIDPCHRADDDFSS
jgi:hypothetical protein